MILRYSRSRLVACALACLLLGPRGAFAQGLKLNGPLPRSIGGDVRAVELSRDGAHLVYVADQDVDERFDLYAVDARASNPVPVRLNLPRDFADVRPRFVITPEGSRVVYVADQDEDKVFELFLAPIDGSAAPHKLNGELVENGDVEEGLRISPNGKRVVYLASQLAADRTELFSAPLDGLGPSIKLNPAIPAGRGVGSFSISPDSRRVVFLVPRQVGPDLVEDLWSASIDGRGGAVLLLEHVEDDFVVSADGKRVFVVALLAEGRRELHAVPIGGGTPLRLTPLPAGRSVSSFVLAAKDARVVFAANANAGRRFELFSIASDGSGSRIQLSGATTGKVSVHSLQLSPDGKRALYVMDKETPGVLELYSVPVDGSRPEVKLSEPLAPSGDVVVPSALAFLPRNELEITPDGRRVVYAADRDADEVFELFSVPLAGGPSVRLNGALPSSGDVVDFDLTPDSRRAVYLADQDEDEVFELFAVPLDGSSAPARINAPLPPGGDVALTFGADADELLDPLRVTPDGLHAIYLAGQESADVVELFRAPLDGTQQTTRMNRELAIGPIAGDVLAFDFAPDGRSVVYLADQEENDVFGLYRVRTDGRGPRVRLSGDLVARGAVIGFRISPDGTRVVYHADQDTDQVFELYTVPLDGSGPPLKLNGPLAPAGNVSLTRIDPTARRVTFQADQAADGRHELFSAPIDGAAPAVRLSGTLVPGGAVHEHRISPDGTRVIYRADQDVAGQTELYSAPIDGSSAAVKLNGTLVAGVDIFHRELAPDSRWVAYVAAQEAADREEVYVVPIDGSAAPLRISGPAVAGANVSALAFTPDGTRVVFDLLPGAAARNALFVAPRDGSRPPLQLSAPGEFVLQNRAILFSPDGLRLLYVASVQGNFGLFSVPVDGSAARVQLGPSAWPGLEPALVSPGGRVVFTLQQSTGDRGTFSVPIDGSAAPVRLAPVIPYDPALLPDGETVLYITEGSLHRVPIDGSAPPAVVASARRAVKDFALDAGGRRVAFLLGSPHPYASGVRELYLDLLDLAPAGVDRALSPGH